MFVVMTRVKLLPGTSDRCAALFKSSNPALVNEEQDWLGARMIFDPSTNIVTVLATWRNVASYERLSSSAEFQQVMQKFSEFFASPPEISKNDILVEMSS